MQTTGSSPPSPRKGFILKSLLFFIIFAALTVTQLFLVESFENQFTFVKDSNILSILCFGVGIFHFLFYFLVEGVRLIAIFNWLIAFFIVECLTLAVMTTAISLSFWQLVESVVTALGLAVLFFAIAALIKYDFTLDVVFLYVFSYVLCIGIVYFLTLYAVDKVAFALYLCLGIILIVIYMFNIYFAQCIIGGFYTEVRLTDYILAALTIYVNFFLLLLISINCVPLIVDVIGKCFK